MQDLRTAGAAGAASAPLRVGSLFAGIGGIDLGLERTGGFRTEWFSEIDPFASSVLARHWPDVPNLGDVRLLGEGTPGVDLIAAGFPCQPVSLAGKRLAQDDPRWLWPPVARLVGHLRPRYVLLENVPGLRSKGLGDVLQDLSALGYDAEWDGVPASAVGAPHRRERVFVVAYPASQSQHESSSQADARDAGGQGGARPAGGSQRVNEPRCFSATWAEGLAAAAPAWAAEPRVGRVADGFPARLDRLAALGNAVVPQVAEVVGRLILNDYQRS